MKEKNLNTNVGWSPNGSKKWILATVIKNLFSLILTCIVCTKSKDFLYLLVGIIELVLILMLSSVFRKNGKVRYWINSILMFIYNVQMMVFIFGNSFVTLVMVTNLDSIKALSGNAALYLIGVVLVLIFSFLPIYYFELKTGITSFSLTGVLIIEAMVLIFFGNWYSPIYSCINLGKQYYQKEKTAQNIEKTISENIENASLIKTEYYKDSIANHRSKNEQLIEKPNVILIFTEGLSQNIVDDEREIMPNVAYWQKQSLNFINYYNHTFATYRGLNGQLYSGHQLGDIENNSLISVQSIFSDLGYSTTFINTEPENQDFTNYLEGMGFDEVVNNREIEYRGLADSISDKDAYEMLYEMAAEKAESYDPFFMAIYTFGTHASFDSIDEKFGNGKDPVLNKFADADAQFGAFMNKIKKNPNFNNTIIVFTAEHATYQDDSFNSAFPDYERKFQSFDKIPLFFYYKGILPETIDAKGRNSLNMAPTLMDYLDISAPNYFLGTSLFADEPENILETTYYDSDWMCMSGSDGIEIIESEEAKQLIHNYNITKALVEKENNAIECGLEQ